MILSVCPKCCTHQLYSTNTLPARVAPFRVQYCLSCMHFPSLRCVVLVLCQPGAFFFPTKFVYRAIGCIGWGSGSNREQGGLFGRGQQRRHALLPIVRLQRRVSPQFPAQHRADPVSAPGSPLALPGAGSAATRVNDDVSCV